jgi:hypothetical protein
MPIAITRIDPQVGSGFGNSIRAQFDLQLSRDYTTAIGGDPIDFTQAGASLFGTSQPPRMIKGPDVYAGYGLQFIRGSALNNSALKVFVQGAAETDPMEELGTGAYAAALTANPIRIEVEFDKF